VASLFKFALFAAALIALLVFVVAPAVIGPMISGAIREAGLGGEDVEVSVDLFGPSLLSGRAPSLHVEAQDVAVSRAVIGNVDVTLHGVSVTDRTFDSVTGTLERIAVDGPGGQHFVVYSVELDGPAAETRASGRISAKEAEALVAQVASDAGLKVEGVAFEEDRIVLRHDGTRSEGTLRVAGEALILERRGEEAVVLLAPAPSDPWTLRDIKVTVEGLQVDMIVDAQALAAAMGDD